MNCCTRWWVSSGTVMSFFSSVETSKSMSNSMMKNSLYLAQHVLLPGLELVAHGQLAGAVDRSHAALDGLVGAGVAVLADPVAAAGLVALLAAAVQLDVVGHYVGRGRVD